MSCRFSFDKHQVEQIWQATRLAPQTQQKYPRTLPFIPTVQQLQEHFAAWIPLAKLELDLQENNYIFGVSYMRARFSLEGQLKNAWKKIMQEDERARQPREPQSSPRFVERSHEEEEEEEEYEPPYHHRNITDWWDQDSPSDSFFMTSEDEEEDDFSDGYFFED